jgi:hypothetical protein
LHSDRGSNVLVTRTIVFPGGRTALAVVAPADVSGGDAVAALRLEPPRGLIVLNGGTNRLPPELTAVLRRSLGDGLARVAVDEGLAVVTGGTDAGVFALFGQSLGDEQPAACVGVAPAGLVAWGDGNEDEGGPHSNDAVPLEPHHSHFLLVRGDEWGAEIEAMMALSGALAAECPSIAVVAGGGTGAKREVLAHTRLGRHVVVLAGTGRFADELADAVASGGSADPETAEAAASGLLTVIDNDDAPAALAGLLRARLGLTDEGAPP